VAGLVVGWMVDRLVVCGLVVGSVVVAVDMKLGVSMKVDCETGRQAGI
jgi:hypothetical protein